MFKVDVEKCIGCEQCIKDCSLSEIYLKEEKAYIKNERCSKCGHCIGICPVDAVYTDDYDMSEVKTYKKEEFAISPENLLNAIKFRRSVRRFKNKEVEREKIEQIIEAGRFTATSSNSQSVSFTVINNDLDKIRNLAYETLRKKGEEILSNSNESNNGYQRYAKYWINMHDAYKKDPQNNDKLFFNAPSVIVVSAEKEIDAALASSNMELMTNVLGLGTCFIGFFVIATAENKELLDLLQIKENKKIISSMVIGYPGMKYQRTVPRKKPDIEWM